jgi:hypothetical protein
MSELLERPGSTPGTSLGRALAHVPSTGADFNLRDLHIFTSVPDHRDFDVVSLRGLVAVYDREIRYREEIQEGAFYVREGQYAPGGGLMEGWHRRELQDQRGRAQPFAQLKTRREVVQAIRWPDRDSWALRLVSGHVDGPYHEWAFGSDLIGKVVGIYLPGSSKGEC